MDKRSQAKEHLEDLVVSDSSHLGQNNQTYDEDLQEIKVFEARNRQIHQIEMDKLEEELKRAQIRKQKFDLEESRRKAFRDQKEFDLKVEKDEREAAERESKAAEREAKESKDKRSEKRWKIVDTILKVGGILLPIGTTIGMFLLSMKMEYVDDKIPSKTMRDLVFRPIKK